MQISEKEKRVKILAFIKTALKGFPHNKLDAEAIVFYVDRLVEFPVKAVAYAIDRCLEDEHNDFFPTIAKIRGAAKYWVYRKEQFILPAMAFDEACKEVQDFDIGRGLRFSNSAISDAVEQIGIANIMANPAAYQEAFFAAYTVAAHKTFLELTATNIKAKELSDGNPSLQAKD